MALAVVDIMLRRRRNIRLGNLIECSNDYPSAKFSVNSDAMAQNMAPLNLSSLATPKQGHRLKPQRREAASRNHLKRVPYPLGSFAEYALDKSIKNKEERAKCAAEPANRTFSTKKVETEIQILLA